MNTPALRFPGFVGEWVERRLGDVATFSKGKGISKSDIADDGKFKCIRYGELYTKYNELIDDVISSTNIDENDLVFSQKNDVIIPASGETALDIATASCVLHEGIALGGDLNIIKSDIDGVFNAYYLNYTKKYDIASLSQGSSVIHLYPTHLRVLKLTLPSLPEQQKIAAFLTAVDAKIAHLSQKGVLLGEYKRGVMQGIFSQEIRFRADNGSVFGDWVERRLGDIGKVSMCKRIMKDETTESGDIPFYKIGTFGKDADAYISKDIYEEFKEKYSFPNKGDILISASGTIGRTVVYDGVPAYFQDSNIVWIDNNEEIVKNIFLLFCYENIKWNTENTTIARLYNTNLRNIQISLPSLPEQTNIANFLSAIDTKISQNTQSLEKMKTFKRGLLQGMFA